MDGTAAIRLLGPFELEVGGRPAEVRSTGGRAVVAALALRAGAVVPLERLAHDLWDEPPPNWRKNLHVRVSRLRRSLDEQGVDAAAVVDTRSDGYVVPVAHDRVDVSRFDALVSRGRDLAEQGDPGAAHEVLAAALALFRGEPLGDLADAPAGRAEIRRLGEARAATVDLDHDLLLELGRPEAVVGGVEAALAEDPLRERRWAQLMVALYRSGRQSDALRAFQRARALLGEELGIEPGPELRRLEAAVLVQDPLLDGPAPRRHGVPVDAAAAAVGPGTGVDAASAWVERQRALPLVGRRGERDLLRAAWRRVSGERVGGVAWITGDPGVGKTRLAAELAAEAAEDGALVLADRCVPGSGTGTILAAAAALGVPEQSDAGDLDLLSSAGLTWTAGAVERLEAVLRERPVVLVLDDVQWAAPDVVGVLRHLLDRPLPLPEPVPLLGVLLVQAGPPLPPGLSGLVGDTGRVPVQLRLDLGPLDDEDALDLLAGRLGLPRGAPALPALIDLVRDTAGNPGRLVQVAERAGPGPPPPGGLAVVGVPPVIEAGVADRLALLSPPARRVVAVAAVVGPSFLASDVAVAADLDVDGVVDALEEATAARLLDVGEAVDGGWSFASAAEHLVVAGRVSPARRALVESRLGR